MLLSAYPRAPMWLGHCLPQPRGRIVNSAQTAGKSMLFHLTKSKSGLSFANKKEVNSIAKRGPLTPDHVIRTKRLPMIGRNVNKYKEEYISYFER